MNYWIAFCLTIQVFNIIFLIRNQKVYEFRKRLLAGIDKIVRHDVALKHLDEMMRVKYSDMLWEWWKPCKSFYSKEILKDLLD